MWKRRPNQKSRRNPSQRLKYKLPKSLNYSPHLLKNKILSHPKTRIIKSRKKLRQNKPSLSIKKSKLSIKKANLSIKNRSRMQKWKQNIYKKRSIHNIINSKSQSQNKKLKLKCTTNHLRKKLARKLLSLTTKPNHKLSINRSSINKLSNKLSINKRSIQKKRLRNPKRSNKSLTKKEPKSKNITVSTNNR